MKRVMVTGAGGFIGGHLVKRLLDEGCEIAAVDVKRFGEWWQKHDGAHNAARFDCSYERDMYDLMRTTSPDAVVNLACDMGGMGYIATHRYECMRSAKIAMSVTDACRRCDVKRMVFASSACVYPYEIVDRGFIEADAWTGRPEPGYGYEKIFSEELALEAGYSAVRFHNVYGPHGSWRDGREKAPAAMCRKAAILKLRLERGDDVSREIEVWGSGAAKRTFLWVDDAVEGVMRMLHAPKFRGPVNIGSDEVVSINSLAMMALSVARVSSGGISHVSVDSSLVGDSYRSSDNALCDLKLGAWKRTPLYSGLEMTYRWIKNEVRLIGIDEVARSE